MSLHGLGLCGASIAVQDPRASIALSLSQDQPAYLYVVTLLTGQRKPPERMRRWISEEVWPPDVRHKGPPVCGTCPSAHEPSPKLVPWLPKTDPLRSQGRLLESGDRGVNLDKKLLLPCSDHWEMERLGEDDPNRKLRVGWTR